jgi:hypothetical protein
MWHVINNEVWKALKYDKIKLDSRTNVISNPHNVVDMLNTFFVEITDYLLNKNSSKSNAQLPKR